MSGWFSGIDMETATLIVNALTPISVGVAGVIVARATKRLETSQWVNQKLTERKIALVADISPAVNDLYCYFMWIGTWKEQSPLDVISTKRALDRLLFSNKPFLSTETIEAYHKFMAQLFHTFGGAGADARLKTGLFSLNGDRRAAYGAVRPDKEWADAWDSMFVQAGQETSRKDIDAAHDVLINRLAGEIGAK